MNMKFKLLFLAGVFSCFPLGMGWTAEPEPKVPEWTFKLGWESSVLTDTPFSLMAAADLNRNGIKELIVTDFGTFGNHMGEWERERGPYRNLFVFEWRAGDLRQNFKKRWDMSIPLSGIDKDKYFLAWRARTVETIAPYLGLEWSKGDYVLHEQSFYTDTVETPLKGSWTFPWLSPSCYGSFPNRASWPRECLVGIRDFSGKGKPKIVTILETKIGEREYKQILRVRKFENGFPIEWEMESPKRFAWWNVDILEPQDYLNLNATLGLFLRPYREPNWFLFEADSGTGKYHLRPVQIGGWQEELRFYDLPDYYLRSTQQKGVAEFWGYHWVDLSTPERNNFLFKLEKVTFKPGMNGFLGEVVEFLHHDHFIGVGYFNLEDLDGDGLDEVILVEETGKITFKGYEAVKMVDVKDYIHILKWDGKHYQTMWVSPPYTKRGTKFLVEDIKNTGKKQLVVMTAQGTIQIWEKQ